MGLFDLFRKKQGPQTASNIVLPTEKALIGYNRSGGTYFRSGGSVLGLLSHCAPDFDPDASPRTVLNEVRATNAAFTPFKEAAEKQSEVMGRVRIESDDPKLEQELQDLADSMTLIMNNRIDGQHKTGLDQAIYNLHKFSTLDGSAFMEMQEGEDGTMNTLRLYDSKRFDVQTVELFRDRLTFIQDNGTLIYVPDTSNLVEYAPVMEPGKPWGIPMAYIAAFMAEQLTRLIINQRHLRDRTSSPPGFAYLGVDTDAMNKMQDHEKQAFAKKLLEIQEQLKELFERGFSNMRSVGDQAFMSGILPGGVNVAESTFGSGVQPIGGFDKEFDRYARMAFLPCRVPYPFIGLDGPAAGLGSDLFEKMMQLFQITAANNRKNAAKVALRIMHTLMDSMRMKPGLKDKFWIEFDAPNLDDMKREADVKRTEQEAFKAGLENYLNIRQMPGFSDAEGKRRAEQFAHESGFDFLEASSTMGR